MIFFGNFFPPKAGALVFFGRGEGEGKWGWVWILPLRDLNGNFGGFGDECVLLGWKKNQKKKKMLLLNER